MAVTQNEMLALADAVKRQADLLKATHGEVLGVLQSNTAHAIDWNALSADWIDSDGVIIGRNFTGPEVANAIGSMDEFTDFYAGNAVSAGSHGSNFELLANPTAVQIRLVY